MPDEFTGLGGTSRDPHFLVLGPLQAWSEGRRLPLGSARAERVLAMLLLDANRLVTMSRLVEAGWDGQPPATAAHQIRKIMADLRQRVPGGRDLIVTDGVGYRITLAEDQLDLSVFDIRLRRAREADAAGLRSNTVAQLEAALRLWRGPALDGMDNPAIEAAAVVLEESRLACVERLVDLRLSLGEARAVVADLRALQAEHPLRETFRRQLMLALYRSGRPAEALQVYHQASQALADELGIQPGPELTTLYERMLRNDPEVNATPPRNGSADRPPTVIAVHTPPPRSLPYDLGDFVGRSAELDQLVSQAHTATERGLAILAIDGMAGVGKTTLAVHAAHQLAADFPDGQLFVDLHGHTSGRTPVEPADALDILLRAWGVPSERIPDDLAARSALWRIQAADRKLMVLLDNAADVNQVRPLLPGSRGCLVMITSRPRLTGLDGAVSVSLDLPPPDEGLDLLVRVLGADRVARSGQGAQALVDACGRLPLALRIAAARLHNRPQWDIDYLVERLRNEERRIGELTVDDRSVAATINLSYRTLGADHQRLFRLLGLHPDDEIDVFAAAALAEIPEEKAELLLEDLLDVRLLAQRQPNRYVFHDLLRAFARSRAATEDTADQRAQARHRLLDYYTHTASAAADIVQPGRFPLELPFATPPGGRPSFAHEAAAMAWFDSERHSLVAAIQHAYAHGFDHHACHLPRAMAYYLQLRGHTQDLQAVLEIAVDAARRLGDPVMEGRGLINLTLPHWHFGRFRTALELAEAALDIAERISDLPSEGVCLGRIGMLLIGLGRFEDALSYHERALEIYPRTGMRREESGARNSISICQDALGRHEDALTSAMSAVVIDQRLGDRSSEAIGLVNVASARMGLAQYDAARPALDNALRLARAVGTPNGEAVVLAHYAELHRRVGRYDQAMEAGQSALRLLQAIRRPAVTAAVENTLGAVHSDRGEYELALERHTNARRLAQHIGLRMEQARALDGTARALHGRGEVAASREYWRLALSDFEAMGVPNARWIRDMLEATSHLTQPSEAAPTGRGSA